MVEAIAIQSGINTLEFRVTETPTETYGVIIDYPAPVPIQRSEWGQTITGTTTARGAKYEPLLQWEIKLAMTRNYWDMLQGFFLRQERARVALTAFELTFLDLYHRYVEPPPQSRAAVSGATIATLASGDKAYFAQYKCVITGLSLDAIDRWPRCTLSLLETSRIPV